jgi:formylglycine-generating enzyme required for sulfatase activity
LTGERRSGDRRAATRDVVPVESGHLETVSSTNVPGARRGRGTRFPTRRADRKRVKVLFFAANAASETRLGLDLEYRAIEQRIQEARYRDAFQLVPKFATHVDDIQKALLEHQPDIVHFACHGSPQAQLVLLSEGSEPAPVPAPALVSLFRVLRDNLTLVVLNACFAGEQAAAIRESATISIGMRERVDDKVAITFASHLYGALAYGRSVGDAFDLGVAAIEASGSRQGHVPELFTAKGVDAHSVHVLREGRRWGFWLLATVVVCLISALAWHVVAPSEPATLPQFPGMVRFSREGIRLGVFDRSRRPAACASLERTEDCAELEHPEAVAEAIQESFHLDQHEVTNGDFAAWLDAHPDLWKLAPYDVLETRHAPETPLARTASECGGGFIVTQQMRVRADPEKSRWPVNCVTWYGASAYCRAQGKRLPLEAEWELAAKGSDGRPFPWGADMPRHDGVVFDRRDGAEPHALDVGVSTQDASPEDVRDLGGNVAEWVEDGRGLAQVKTIRGGSWASRGACHVLASGCKRIPAETYGQDVGFRCARSATNRDQRTGVLP